MTKANSQIELKFGSKVSVHPLTGDILYFDEEQHIYCCGKKDGTTQPLTSVSAFISMFAPKFDTMLMASRVASKRGMSIEDVVGEWDKKRDDACDMGTRVHANQEMLLAGKEPVHSPLDERERGIMDSGRKAVCDILNKGWRLDKCEFPVFSPEYGVAGTVDMIFRREDEWMIADWKTNKEINDRSKYGKKMLVPISHLDDCNLTKYSIQLNTYMRLLKKAGYIDDSDKTRMTIFHLTPESYRAIRVQPMQELDDLLNCFQSQL